MKVYIPFFVISGLVVFAITFLYKPVYDYKIQKNIFGYDTESFLVLARNDVDVDRYYKYIDCNANAENFIVENIEFYKFVESCDYDILKINTLLQYYSEKDVLILLDITFDYKLVDNENKDKVYEIVNDEYYISENFVRYLEYEGDKPILNVNLNHDLKEYTNYNLVPTLSHTVVVNSYNRLSEYNSNLTYCVGYYVFDEKMCEGFRGFMDELRDENISFSVTKINDRSDLFNEHSTGLAIDFEYDYSMENYVETIASKHGFILRYKSEYLNVTKREEFGHYRFVGEKSHDIYSQQVSLEEYLYAFE